jgi:hypothetical protein
METGKPPRVLKLSVQVTHEHIEFARKRRSRDCMIKRAVEDALMAKNIVAVSIEVDLQSIRFSVPETRLRYAYFTPRAAQGMLLNWDRGEDIEPFSFSLGAGKISGAGMVTNMHAGKEGSKVEHVAPRRATIAREPNGTFYRTGGRTPPKLGVKTRREFGLRAFVR